MRKASAAALILLMPVGRCQDQFPDSRLMIPDHEPVTHAAYAAVPGYRFTGITALSHYRAGGTPSSFTV